MVLNPPHVEVQNVQFVFQDRGGTAERGKIRTERTKEDRKYQEFIHNIKGNYNFDQAS
jgi:hypothetical protein